MTWPRSPSGSSLLSPSDEDFPVDDLESEENMSDKPYAKLIWEAMMEKPDKRMTLKEIYNWFTERTNKPKDSQSNGWQNSIRHNLSMNHAFESEKGDPSARNSSKKSNNVWVLTPQAIEHGVESTTRYRNKCPGKKAFRSKRPAFNRQVSGRKGGKAARRSAREKQRLIELSRSSERTIHFGTDIRYMPRGVSAGSDTLCSKSYGRPGSPITPTLDSQLSCASPCGPRFPKNETMDANPIFGMDPLRNIASAGGVKREPLIEQPEEMCPDPYLTEMWNMQQVQGWGDSKTLTFYPVSAAEQGG
ncbi:MAG: hypothetical protein Q9227_000054 [Pyrenula ochraceoflavens]